MITALFYNDCILPSISHECLYIRTYMHVEKIKRHVHAASWSTGIGSASVILLPTLIHTEAISKNKYS